MIFLKKVSRGVNTWVERSLFVMGATMAIIVAMQVFFRYVLNYSLFWSEELARYILVWLTFLGASAAYRRGVHPGVDVIYRRVSTGWQRLFNILSHMLALGFFGIMIFYGCQFAYFVRLQITPALALPKWILFSVIPISGVLLALHALWFLSEEIRGGTSQ